MELTLTPELEHRIDRELKYGHYGTAADVLSRAMDALENQRADHIAFRATLNAKLDESIAAAKRGEIVPAEQIESDLDVWAENLMAQK